MADPSDSSDNNAQSSSGSDISADAAPAEIVCSRCQTPSSETRSMVCFAINCYYCARCARIVGYGG
jgi:late competence protein required for DNA uptake (superfamily II DNA/RNA helicase)